MRADPYQRPAWASKDHVPVESDPCGECGRRVVVWVTRNGKGAARAFTLKKLLASHFNSHANRRRKAHEAALAEIRAAATNPRLEDF